MHIVCPSGLSGDVRGLTVRELQLLADQSLARGGRNIDVMLGMMEKVVDPGPYKFAAGSKPKWDNVLLGDRFSALVDIRVATWGAEYWFPVRCADCREGFEWELDLRDLPRKPFPKETLDQLAEGANRFVTEGPNGEEVGFKLLYGSDEKSADSYRRRTGSTWGLGDVLAQRILSVNGKGSQGDPKIREWIMELGALAAVELGKRMDEADGGVETEIEVVCTKCGWQQWIQLPFDKAFYAPSRKRATNATTKTEEPKTKGTMEGRELSAETTPTGSSSPMKKTA